VAAGVTRLEKVDGQLDVICRQCRRVLATVIWDPRTDAVLLLAATYPPETRHRISVGERRAARWWHDDGTDLSERPRRYGFDCGGKHHGTGRSVTVERLTRLYLDAVDARPVDRVIEL
jgi:hypothetical protein